MKTMTKAMLMAAALAATVAQAGDSAPFLLDTAEGTRIAHETEPIAYSPRWGNAASCTVDLEGSQFTATEEGSTTWPRPATPGGYTLTHTAGSLAYTAQFTVLGEDVATHAGTLMTNETWSADKVLLVTADVTVPSGVLLLIEPGAVVKFMPGTSLIVENGAICTVIGVVFTHANDDTLQGDTLFDGETAPVQDDYKIVGVVNDDDTTEYRYMAPQELTSNITSNIRLRGHRVYVVSNDVTVESGATLTIQPGAILKFASGKSLTVNSGGTLNAQGSRALPVVFTSLKDDSVGGDTNEDADATHAESGDWARIYVSGSARMDYCTIRYCNNNSDCGAIQGRDSGSVTFDNSMIEYSVYECVRMGGSSKFVAHNSVFRESSMGFGYYGGSGTYAYNCIVADCTVGCRASSKYFYNTIFYNCKSFTDQGGDNSSYRNCLFFNTVDKISEGFASSYQKVGANGNAWGNPHFIDPNNGDFRIAADSPCVDAGDPAYAPKTDYFGQKRVTVMQNDGEGAVATQLPDIGIHEVMPREVKSDVDLAVESVIAPESFTVGEKIAVTWNVKNVGSETASGMWSDKVELVCANGSAVELGTVATSATIPADGVQTFSGTFTVPSAQVGAVRVRVTANANRDIFEGTLTANNVAESEAATLTMPELAFPDSGVASFNVSAGGSVGYRLGGGFADGGLLIVHVASATAGGVKVWTGNGQVPTADIFYAAAVEVGGGDYLVRVPAGGDAYVSFANEGSGLAKVDVGVEKGAFLLFDTGVVTSPNAGTVTLTLFGNGFEDGMETWIEKGGTRSSASEIVVFDPVKAVATFDVTNLAPGTYEVHVKRGGAEDAASLLALTETRLGPKWSCKLDIASAVRSSREYVGYLEYSNTGDMPLDAPYVKITAGSGSFIRFGTSDAWGDTLELMAISETYPASQLKPGETRRIPFRYKTTADTLSIECGYTQDDKTAFPWDTNAAYMRPSWASDELWGLALAVLKSNVGATWNDYLARMRANCDHLAKIGQPTHRLDRIWQLEINEALGVDHAVSTLASNTDLARSGRGFGLALSRSYGSGLYRRLRKGVFGYGWSDNYGAYAELQNSGATLALHSGSGSTYLFEKVGGKWTPEDARDKTTCAETSTEYVLTYRSGTVQRIAKSNMRVSSVTDNQGNSLSFTYNADKQLVKVEHCDGQSLSFAYAGGLLASATDDQGRTTRYEYSGDLLVKVTAFNGLSTQYRYLLADGSVTSRALRQIAYADGTTRDFTYGADGFVATMATNGDKQMTRIAHTGIGEYSVTAPNGGVSSSVVGWAGEQLHSVNALNQKTTANYTAEGMLDSLVGSTGKRAKASYDEDGQMAKSVDAAGAETGFGYTSDYGKLASVTDARGNAFKYGYDKKGQPNSIEYADGTLERIAYSDRGDITNAVNRRGQSIFYTYDDEGRMLSKIWENGRTFTWAYDAKGNCTNATDSATGTVTMEYDENERLVRIVHPKGRGFAYTYDALGRTTSRTTLVGRGVPDAPSSADIQRYTYDSLGRLSRMTDGDGNLYVENYYDDTTGWLVTQTYGNGTIVSNAYDILGRTIGIYHGRAGTPCPPWLAFFEYAYDAEGRRILQTTAEGVERYTYDTVGQLTDVIYPDGSEEHFTYDAVGNRVTSSRTGGSPVQEETYTANNLNQYTEIVNAQAARSTMEYDLDGNMTRKGDTHYYYDIQNRLVAVTNTTKDIAWSCEYDVFGNRTKVVDHGMVKETLFVQGSLASAVADYDASGSPTTRHILLGSVRLADITGTTGVSPVEKRYYHSDGLASTRLLTDANGDTIGTASYRAFGEVCTTGGAQLAATALSAGWIGTLGVERDDATGLVFMRNRYYDVEQGRFVQKDPIGLLANDVNMYRYCGNSPMDNSDTLGLWCSPPSNEIPDNSEAITKAVKKVIYNLIQQTEFKKRYDALCFAVYALGNPDNPCSLTVSYSPIPIAPSVTFGRTEDGYFAVKGGISASANLSPITWSSGYMTEGASLDTDLGLIGGYGTSRELKKNATPTDHLSVGVVGGSVTLNTPTIRVMRYDTLLRYMALPDEWLKETLIVAQSYDPNEMAGPAGVGAQRYVKPGEPMDYTIYFENATNATAAAIKIAVTLPKDANLDWSTLELGEVVFGDHTDTGFVDDKTTRSIKYALADSGCEVHTTVTETDSDITWNLRVWDPTTSDHFPDDFKKGVLPPNDPDTHCGEGHISFRVCVKNDAVPNNRINASASIVFDDNPAIITDPAWWNTVAGVANVTIGDGEGAIATQLIVGMPYGDALPGAPANGKPGHTFAGWYTGPNGTGRRVTAQSLVEAGDSELYAYWLAHAYTVRFNANGGEGLMSDQAFEFDKAGKLDANAFTRKYYAFTGWATNEMGAAVFEDCAEVTNLTAVDGGVVTLYAAWQYNAIEVAFDAQGGTPVPANSLYDLGVAYGVLPEVARAGYTFGGWFTGPNGTGDRVTAQMPVRTDVAKLYAHWLAHAYMVRFHANGGEGAMSDQAFEFDKAGTLDANAFTRKYFEFAGWATNETGEAVYADGALVENLTMADGGIVELFATWTRQTVSVTVGDGVVVQLEAGTPYGDNLKDPEARVGYTFGGWFTEPDGGGRRITSESAVDPDIGRLYPYWIKDVELEPEPTERPVLYAEVTGAVPVAASTYEGYLYDANGNVKGTIQVKVGKPNKKTGLAAVKATVIGMDGKKKTLKAAEKGKAQIAADGPTTVPLAGGEMCEVTLGAKGMSGTYGAYAVDGALNVFTSKDAADKAVASVALGKWQGAVNVAWQDDGAARPEAAPYQGLSVTIAAKGKAKVAGTLADGTKVSAKGQLVVGEDWCCVPVVYVKKGVKLMFNVWLPRDGAAAGTAAPHTADPVVVGLGDAIVGKPGTLKAGATFRLGGELGDAKYGAYLPNGVAVGGGAKWTLPKAGKVQLAKDGAVDAAKLGENPSALKLTYKAKDGTFKGSFKAYSDANGKPKGATMKVAGVLVNGVGYGAVTVKGGSGVAVTIE